MRRHLRLLVLDLRPAQQIVLQDYIHAVEDAKARLVRLERQITELLPAWSMAPVVEAVQAMRGVALIVAVTVVAEVGDFSRFALPASSWPTSDWSHRSDPAAPLSAAAASPRPATPMPAAVLIEGAWTYRMQARVSRKLLDRLERLPQAVRDVAWKAQLRLCHRYRRLGAAGKPKVVVTTAIAREMVGFIWAIAQIVQPRAANG